MTATQAASWEDRRKPSPSGASAAKIRVYSAVFPERQDFMS
jgi:hypothetical protein